MVVLEQIWTYHWFQASRPATAETCCRTPWPRQPSWRRLAGYESQKRPRSSGRGRGSERVLTGRNQSLQKNNEILFPIAKEIIDSTNHQWLRARCTYALVLRLKKKKRNLIRAKRCLSEF